MSDAMIFAMVFIAFVVIRIVGATVFFYLLLPSDDRCPNCDTPTIRVQSKVWNFFLPWFRTSWCYNCHWEGVLRHGGVPNGATTDASKSHKNVGA
jgi:hypothetical protein